MSELNLDQLMQQATDLHQSRRLEEAARLYIQILDQYPNHAPALHGMGAALCQGGQLQPGLEFLTEAVAADPTNGEYHYHLGAAFEMIGQPDNAAGAYRRAADLWPGRHEPLVNLANILSAQGRLTEAENVLRRASEIRPDVPEIPLNLGGVLRRQGRIIEAIECCRTAMRINPGIPEAAALLLWMHYDPRADPAAIFAEHRRWAEPFDRLAAGALHANDRDPDRKLRIGYVSPDFREHAVNYFLEPILANHDRSRFEIFCYADLAAPDAVTRRLQAFADHWRDISKLNHDAVANLVRQDSIDILVDLAGHTGQNRLPVFARKPAPVQATYLGYPNTTGLRAIDYRLTDASADPPGATEQWHTEKLVRLPQTAWCYQPPAQAPDVAPSPSAASGIVTFASFNVLAKLNAAVMDTWSEILKQTPRSRLILKNSSLSDEGVRTRFQSEFATRGIEPHRVELIPRSDSHADHLATYAQVDIALDPFPYNGTTTTCEALWMGVPVITLAGTTHVSRVGASLLTTLNIPDLIARNASDYIHLTTALATEPPRLTTLRQTLRSLLSTSPLTDGPAMARNIEDAYQEMWRTWCKSPAVRPVAL